MSPRSTRIEGLYVWALRLYPAGFQELYAEPMRQAVRDALADGSVGRPRLVALLLRDFMTSLIKEHFAMVRDGYARPAIVFNALVLAGRSLREVQARIDHVQNLARLAWLGMLGLILAGSVAFGWITRKKAIAAAV